MDMGARGEPLSPAPLPVCDAVLPACQRRASCRGTLGGGLAFKNKGLLLQTCLPEIQTFRSDLSIASDSRLHLKTDTFKHKRVEDGAGQSHVLIEASFRKSLLPVCERLIWFCQCCCIHVMLVLFVCVCHRMSGPLSC